MAFVPSYTHDIFVSYAELDDKPLYGSQAGWVTTLVRELKTLLAQRLGSEDYELSMAHHFPGNVLSRLPLK